MILGFGTVINVIAILVGGVLGWALRGRITDTADQWIRLFLVVVTFVVSVSMIWKSLPSGFLPSLGHLALLTVALVLGNVLGKLLRLQAGLDRLGRWLQSQGGGLVRQLDSHRDWNEAFVTATLLFCAGPMAVLGSIQDGIQGDPGVLLVKAGLDGVTTVGLMSTLGPGVVLAAFPVLVYQGTLTLFAGAMAPWLDEAMLGALAGSGGMLLMMIPLVILRMGRVPLMDYLPALVVAPLLMRWF